MPYCDRCDRYFNSDYALDQHEQNSPRHWICFDSECNKDFASEWALIQHFVQSSVHPYCQRCKSHFNTFDDLEDHYEDEHWYCSSHNKIFDFEHGLQEHNRQKHYYCVQCKRHFTSESNLDHHLRSSIHQPRAHHCPGYDCGKSFVSNAHLILHLESGTCRSGATRQSVDRFAIQMDTSRVITDSRRLIQYGDGSYAPQGSVVEDQWATEESWNGYGYECVLCHKEFRALSSLNAHLRSPAHADKIYKCPTMLDGCGVQFNTLSGLVQHVESGSCGVRRFQRQVNSLMDDVTSGMRRLTEY